MKNNKQESIFEIEYNSMLVESSNKYIHGHRMENIDNWRKLLIVPIKDNITDDIKGYSIVNR